MMGMYVPLVAMAFSTRCRSSADNAFCFLLVSLRVGSQEKGQEVFCFLPSALMINQFTHCDFFGYVYDIIHLPDPFHLIFFLKLFGNALHFGVLLD